MCRTLCGKEIIFSSTVWHKGIICVIECGGRGKFVSYSVAPGDNLCSTVWHKGIIFVVQCGVRWNIVEYSVGQGDNLCSTV